MLERLANEQEGTPTAHHQPQHAAAREGQEDDVNHQESTKQTEPFLPELFLLQSHERRHANAGIHGDGDTVVIQAAESVVPHAVPTAEVSQIHLEGHIPLTEYDHPRKLPNSLNRVEQGQADHEREEDLAEALQEIKGSRIGVKCCTQGYPAPKE